MLDNDPPPGTQVRFVYSTKGRRALEVGTLISPQGRYPIESPSDEFRVRMSDGEIVTVTRLDIVKV